MTYLGLGQFDMGSLGSLFGTQTQATQQTGTISQTQQSGTGSQAQQSGDSGFGQIAQAALQSQQSWIDFYKYLTTEKYQKKRMKLENESIQLQMDIAKKRSDLEAEIMTTQNKIANIQAAGLEQRQALELDLLGAQVEYAKKQIADLEQLDVIRVQVEELKLTQQKEELQANLDNFRALMDEDPDAAKNLLDVSAQDTSSRDTPIDTAPAKSTQTVSSWEKPLAIAVGVIGGMLILGDV